MPISGYPFSDERDEQTLGRWWAADTKRHLVALEMTSRRQRVFVDALGTRRVGVETVLMTVSVSVRTPVLEAVNVVVAMLMAVGTNTRPPVSVMTMLADGLEDVGVSVIVPDTLTDHMNGVIPRVLRRLIVYLAGITIYGSGT